MFLSNLLTGRGRRVSRRTGHSGSPSRDSLSPRRLRCEPLEERQLMSVFTYTNDPNPKPRQNHLAKGVSSVRIARGTPAWTKNRRAEWKTAQRIVKMVRLLPFGAYPSGAYMENPR